jgi:hypothetical protein
MAGGRLGSAYRPPVTEVPCATAALGQSGAHGSGGVWPGRPGARAASPSPQLRIPRSARSGGLGTLELQGTSRGDQGYREFDAEWRSAWDAYWIVPQALIDLGDRYLIIVEMAGHARGSTLTVTQPAAILEELDDRGMIIREQRFTDPAQALTCSDLVTDDVQQQAARRRPRPRPHGS